jgi:hypothetical protein
MQNLLNELKRRQIAKAVIVYVFVAWVFAQIGIHTFPVMGLPDWTASALAVALILAFPYAVYKAWRQHDDQ